ncbi:serine hydrolase [Bacteroides sp. 51]|uniref:serine hydrolase n=1 Tax=Bacteroides sp. 51 TaxID=2302938 RepID=UPI0013CF81FB|nr:serine hydrolase [Bacteroides sp. 51]NDV81027.1 esterase [Bacteroides sp. 51]
MCNTEIEAKLRYYFLFLLLSLPFSLSFGEGWGEAVIAPELLNMDSRRLAYADEAILKSIENKEIPGAVLAVVHKGKLAYLKAYGNKQTYPSPIPMDVNTVFDMASVSKSMSTAISAMILIERGQLRMADPVVDFIPNFEDWKSEEDNYTVAIRVGDLLTHTSGLPPYAPVKELEEKYGAPNPDGMIEYISTCKRDFRPKTKFQYSCLNYITLQRIIETISGKNLSAFAKENIFDILGMTHTGYQPTGETLERVAPTEKQEDGSVLRGVVHDPLARVMNGGISGNAGVFSDAKDLAILAATLLNNGTYNGKRILSPLGVKTMRTVPRGLEEFGRTPGWDIYSPYASNSGDLFGPNTYGHTGFTGTSFILDPDNDTAVILLINSVHPSGTGNVVRLRSLVANAVAASINCPPERIYFQHYYNRVELFKTEAPISGKDIVFLGNSLTEGGKWSELLGKKNIRNRGVAGDVAMGVYDRLDQILPGRPKKIFFLIGANDISHDLTVDSIVNAITQVVDRIQQESPKTKLYLQSLLPINESFGRYKRMTGKTNMIPEINKRLETVAKERKIPFINLYPLFTKPETNILREELTGDGLHLNEEGYKIWVKALKPYI